MYVRSRLILYQSAIMVACILQDAAKRQDCLGVAWLD